MGSKSVWLSLSLHTSDCKLNFIHPTTEKFGNMFVTCRQHLSMFRPGQVDTEKAASTPSLQCADLATSQAQALRRVLPASCQLQGASWVALQE